MIAFYVTPFRIIYHIKGHRLSMNLMLKCIITLLVSDVVQRRPKLLHTCLFTLPLAVYVLVNILNWKSFETLLSFICYINSEKSNVDP